jgi:Protein of unknown function (DUF2486)
VAYPKDMKDPSSIPVLTDVLTPGRPPAARREEPKAGAEAPSTAPEPADDASARGPQAEQAEPAGTEIAIETEGAAEAAETEAAETEAAETEAAETEAGGKWAAQVAPSAGETRELNTMSEMTERDAERIAERLRVRFASYLRGEGRGVIEARCHEALQEHTSWLVRQVTREVAFALEADVASWVRDAVREELAAHASTKR